jgi:hypothetical protein
MTTNVSEFTLNRLTEWGISRVYGYPGEGINGLIGAFHTVGDRLQFTQCRHEEIAAFAATAHAKQMSSALHERRPERAADRSRVVQGQARRIHDSMSPLTRCPGCETPPLGRSKRSSESA